MFLENGIYDSTNKCQALAREQSLRHGGYIAKWGLFNMVRYYGKSVVQCWKRNNS